MPEPAPITADKPIWEWRVIEQWHCARRGQGWAAVTTADLTGHRR